MIIRKYQSLDCEEMAQLFYDTVHTINRKDYSKEQLDVWADGKVDIESWNQRYLSSHTLVAIEDKRIVGFGNIDDQGYLDMLYVHKEYQNNQIATKLCNQLEKFVTGKITTYASISVKGFFEKRGYRVIRENEVIRKGITLTNYLMEKE